MLREALLNDARPVSVDIACTVYNHEKYLREALDGMLMQETDFPYRIIIHDDASTDNSAEIIREYQARYPDKIIAIIEEENLYQNGKSIYMKMFPYYTAKYRAVCEGDDFWTDRKKLQKQVDYLEAHPDCIACYHNILPVNEDSRYDESLRHSYILLDEGDYTKKEIKNFILKTQTASLVKRNLHPFLSDADKTAYQSAKCNGDEKALLLSGTIGRVHYLPDVMAAHRRVFLGDSYTARQSNKSEVDKFIGNQQRYMEKRKLYAYLTGIKLYPYNNLIHGRMIFIITHHRELKKSEINKIYRSVHVPVYAYIAYFPYAFTAIILKIGRIIKEKIVR